MYILEALLSLQNSLPEEKTFCKMIRTILQNLDFVKTATIYDVAELCYTSTASVIRLCNRLGYQSFPIFRAELADILDHYQMYRQMAPHLGTGSSAAVFENTAVLLQSKLAAIQAMDARSYEQVADILHQKKNIHYFTHYYNAVVFLPLQQDLTINGKCTYYHCFEKQNLRPSALLSSDTVAIFMIPNLPKDSPIVRCLQEAIRSPAYTIVFAMSKRKIWGNADMAVYLPGSNTSFTDINLANYAMELLSAVYNAKYIGSE